LAIGRLRSGPTHRAFSAGGHQAKPGGAERAAEIAATGTSTGRSSDVASALSQ
jgi:hypothetical protein